MATLSALDRLKEAEAEEARLGKAYEDAKVHRRRARLAFLRSKLGASWAEVETAPGMEGVFPSFVYPLLVNLERVETLAIRVRALLEEEPATVVVGALGRVLWEACQRTEGYEIESLYVRQENVYVRKVEKAGGS